MKKSILILLCCIGCSTIFAASWLDKVADTVNTVNDIVNSDQIAKTTIKNIKEAGSKYVNRTVQVYGKVIGLAVDKENKYAVFIENNEQKIKVVTSKKPVCRLLDNITVTGIYNGEELENATINS
jgi:mannose/fructose/N-acetylgalactosamine-specific phosphotransferase system component IIB